jgi:ribulose-phosphate 3-epimerase
MTFHQEAARHPEVVIQEFKKLGVKVGMSIKPKTPAALAIPHLKDLDVLLVMTVEPGFGGQSFMADMLPKIKEISSHIKKNNLSCKVEVDGGIDPTTAPQTIAAGADVLVAGNAIFGKPDPVAALRELKAL